MLIRTFVKLGKWLESRFPEKCIVSIRDYNSLHYSIGAHNVELEGLRQRLGTLEAGLEALVSRLGHVETVAVHKEAVGSLVTVTKGLKDELASLKVSLGMSRIGNSEIQAMLNGEAIPAGEDEQNG